MSKINIANLNHKQLAQVLDDALATETGEKVLLSAMDRLFADGKWEIPDDAIVGIYARKIDQMQQQIQSLTARMVELSGAPAVIPGGRVDALEAAKTKGKAKR